MLERGAWVALGGHGGTPRAEETELKCGIATFTVCGLPA